MVEMPRRLSDLLQTQIEIRRVDADEHVRRIGKQPAR
jgi:hypothetical protein